MLTGLNGMMWPWKIVPTFGTEENLIPSYIRRIIGTIKKERDMDPSFGSKINELVFENKGPAFRSLIHREITIRLAEFLPIITVLKIDIKYSTEDNKPEEVEIFYSYNGEDGSARGDLR